MKMFQNLFGENKSFSIIYFWFSKTLIIQEDNQTYRTKVSLQFIPS